MAKNGFSMSNRVAVDSVSAARTLTADDCGKLIVATATGSGYTITLPTVASAGEGWNCEIVLVSGAVAKDVIISKGSDGTKMNSIAIHALSSSSDAEISFGAISTFKFEELGVTTGDRVKIVGDGSRWYAEFFTNSTGTIS